jgi:hypothetical protein
MPLKNEQSGVNLKFGDTGDKSRITNHEAILEKLRHE